MIRRKKTTIFTDAKDNTTVLELKKMIEGKIFIFICPFVVFYDEKKKNIFILLTR